MPRYPEKIVLDVLFLVAVFSVVVITLMDLVP